MEFLFHLPMKQKKIITLCFCKKNRKEKGKDHVEQILETYLFRNDKQFKARKADLLSKHLKPLIVIMI